jgi:hypothetical protein
MNYDDDHDPDHDSSGEPDRGKAVTPAPAGGALDALTALGTTLNAVDTSSVSGRSGLPMMQFKRENNGTWLFGQKGIIPEAGSRWAVNPRTFKRGYICFREGSKYPDEQMLSVSKPMLDPTKLPDLGGPWKPQWSVNLKCVDGADAGVEVVFKTTTDGGIRALAELINTIRDRCNGNQHDGKIVPIVLLGKDSYPHSEFGRIWIPVPTVVDWMPLDGPAPTPAPASPSPAATEQPRRRRVG